MKQGKNIFTQIQVKTPPKNAFDLTHDVKMSMRMGELTPVLALECIPSDKFDLGAESLIRFAPLVSPVMHRLDVTIHYFFVPNRLLWPNWEKFITDPNSGIVHPWITMSDFDNTAEEKRFANYMGVPKLNFTGPGTGYYNLNAFRFAAYQAVYHEYYRDQNLIPEFNYKLVDGQNSNAELLKMRRRAWEHDYFTSALPWAQKSQAVSIPLGDVVLKDPTTPLEQKFIDPATGVTPGTGYLIRQDGTTGTGDLVFDTTTVKAILDPNGTMEVDSTTITDLRRAFKLQEWLEKAARSGSRYIEHLKAFFNVNSSDKRLQRPEYITGVKSPVVISEVLNTSGQQFEDGASGLPQGNQAGHAVAVTTGRSGSFYCEEHGYIIGIMSVMPKTAYQQGIHKSLLKLDPLDYYYPEFAHIGEQEILNLEIYNQGSAADYETFGYIPRYAEYKFMPSRVCGDFQESLDFWHMGRIFDTAPQLNQEFIECNPTERIFAVTDPNIDKLYVHVMNKITSVRPMPVFGNPYM